METNYHLNQSARDAYRSYMLAYNSHSMKDVFNVHRLDVKVQRRINTFAPLISLPKIFFSLQQVLYYDIYYNYYQFYTLWEISLAVQKSYLSLSLSRSLSHWLCRRTIFN